MSYSGFLCSLGLSSNSQPTETLAESSKSGLGSPVKSCFYLCLTQVHTHMHKLPGRLPGKHADLFLQIKQTGSWHWCWMECQSWGLRSETGHYLVFIWKAFNSVSTLFSTISSSFLQHTKLCFTFYSLFRPINFFKSSHWGFKLADIL